MTRNGKVALVTGASRGSPAPFWEPPLWRWDAMVTVGVRGALVAAALALEFGVTDVDGRQPRPLSFSEV